MNLYIHYLKQMYKVNITHIKNSRYFWSGEFLLFYLKQPKRQVKMNVSKVLAPCETNVCVSEDKTYFHFLNEICSQTLALFLICIKLAIQ